MARSKKINVSNVVCVRVSDSDMECVRQMMRITQKSASSVLREAFKALIKQAA